MTTVASRTFRSTPQRDACQTWDAIVKILTQGRPAHKDLLAASGVASSIIADQAPKSAPIIVTCNGPRTRIYCVYDDDAIESSGGDENPLGFNPLEGEWKISLPCHPEDLSWVQASLAKIGNRITARDLATGLSDDNQASPKITPLVLNRERFLNP